MRRKAPVTLFLIFFLVLRWAAPAYAEGSPIACIMTGEDVGNGYEYTVPSIGSFTVNGMEGETLQAAVFTIEEGCYAVLVCDGDEVDFDEMVLDPGSYELYLYRDESREGDYGVFRFTVENTFTEELTEQRREVRIEENPPLTMQIQPSSGRFRYTLPDGKWFETTVPVGGWYRGQEDFSVSDGLNVYRVTCEGEILALSDGLHFAREGNYEVLLRDNELGMDGDVSYRVVVSFRLYLNPKQNVSLIRAPQGLTIAGVWWEDQPLEAGESHFFLPKDGDYRFAFANDQGTVCWQTELTRDTVLPAVQFDRPVDGKTWEEPVAFQIPDPRTSLRILRSGEEVQASQGRISVNGVYHIEATDEAGNVRDYDFTIRARYDIPGWIWMIIPCILLVLIGIGIATARKGMRVI